MVRLTFPWGEQRKKELLEISGGRESKEEKGDEGENGEWMEKGKKRENVVKQQQLEGQSRAVP